MSKQEENAGQTTLAKGFDKLADGLENGTISTFDAYSAVKYAPMDADGKDTTPAV